ncbi:MAG TPA: hypothetical protein VFV33_00600, partial [Gemmatimonadaceae bacterium]|nr:hypothetical protein [Gemmatimonadaceae bacterium]
MSNVVEALYRRAPWPLRDLAVSAYGLYLDRQRFGGEFNDLLQDAIARTHLSREEAAEHRARLFAERIAPALRGVAAYGTKPSSLAELEALPAISKHVVRANASAFVNARLPARRRVPGHTSGTTGAGLKFWSTVFAQRRQWAYWWRYRTWHGIQPGEWCAVFGGRPVVPPDRTRPPFWHVNLGGRTVLFSQYHLAPERVASYLEAIRRRRIRWIHGYPSVIALIAQAGIAQGLAGSVPMRWVTTGAENLLPFQRDAIERMFGVRPRQHYGLAEGIASISECPEGRLHVDEDFSHVEFVPHRGDAKRWSIVGTTLDNEAMPLLRYECGDVVELA